MRKRTTALGATVLALLALGPLTASAAAEEHLGEFTSVGYPAALVGTQVGKHVFHAALANIECSTATFSGTLTKKNPELSVAPNYEKCTSAAGPVVFKANGCTYSLHAGFETKSSEFFGLFDLVCPVGQRPTFTFTFTGCVVSARPEKGLDEVFYFTTGGNDFKVSFVKSNFAYAVSKDCGVPVMEYEDGTYTGESTFKGNNGAVAVS